MNRREFIKKSIQAAAAAGAYTMLPASKLFGAAAEGKTPPHLVAVKNSTPAKMYAAALAAMGGISQFVRRGQTVVVKPNIGWDVTPELGGNTNPQLVEAVVKSCVDAGAKKVYVFDHTCDNWKKTYKTSGIEDAAKKAGALVVSAASESDYVNVKVPGGKTLKETKVHKLAVESDVFINVPVLKNHGSSGLTIAMKNLMGIVWNRWSWHATGLHQCIADFAAYRKPDLNIVDCYRVMKANGPRGVSKEDVVLMKTLIMSKDMVAADAASAKIAGADPEGIEYIKIADAKGIGTMNLDSINIRRITL
ncbi:MAG: DUF362 domain-containing protein [Candidatus Goldbacteria bacterium]|nr:DUF362 domain-containing protein [Candidatus Goldiibacteriota bacterium]